MIFSPQGSSHCRPSYCYFLFRISQPFEIQCITSIMLLLLLNVCLAFFYSLYLKYIWRNNNQHTQLLFVLFFSLNSSFHNVFLIYFWYRVRKINKHNTKVNNKQPATTIRTIMTVVSKKIYLRHHLTSHIKLFFVYWWCRQILLLRSIFNTLLCYLFILFTELCEIFDKFTFCVDSLLLNCILFI